MFRRAQARLLQRWDARLLAPGQRVSAAASCEIVGVTPTGVWAFVRPAESSLLLDPDVLQAFTVPGTGPGAGEQQRFRRRSGAGGHVVQTLTVISEEPGRCAETRMQDVEAGSRFEVLATELGTTYSVTTWWDLPRGHPRPVYASAEAEIHDYLSQHVRRVKALLESGSN